jgi:uncharacterized Zn finger protein (UPF0148 family)
MSHFPHRNYFGRTDEPETEQPPMPDKFKPCPNCGTANITVEGLHPDSTVFCDECGEERTLEEWQTDTAREKILRSRLEAADELMGALKHIAEYWNQDENEKAMADACWQAIETANDAIAKWEAVND